LKNVQELFAIMHHNFNSLFLFMYRKTNGHFNAAESRQLISNIKLYEETHHVLRSTPLAFDIEINYKNLITQCKNFLTETGGSPIPPDLLRIDLLEYETIFFLSQTVKVESSNEQLYPCQMIGGGSYANVYKYTDGFYNKNRIIGKF